MRIRLRRRRDQVAAAQVTYCEACGGVCDAVCRVHAATDRVRDLRVALGRL